MGLLQRVDSYTGGDEVNHSTYLPIKKNLTVRELLNYYKEIKTITVGFILVNKDRTPIVPMIHFGRGIVRPGTWDKEYYKKKVKKVYITDSYSSLDYEIEVE